MFQLNVPRKTTATIQVWVSVALLVAALFLSLAPIITLKTADNADGINEMIAKIAPDADFEIPERVDITAIKLVKSVGVMGKLMGSITKGAKAMAESQDGEAAEGAVSDMKDTLTSEDGKETIIIAIAMVKTIADSVSKDEDGNKKQLSLASILVLLVSIIAVIALLVMTVLMPIQLIIAAVKGIVPAVKGLQTPEAVSATVAAQLPKFLSMPLTLMLFQCVIPGMEYGSGVIGVAVCAILSVVLGLVISRLRSYKKEQFVYLNIAQGVSIVSLIGFLVFFFNLLKVNVFTSFLNGKLADYLLKVGIATAAKADHVNNAYATDLLLIVVYLFIALSVVSYIDFAAKRLSCTMGANKKGVFPKDSKIVMSVVMLALYIIPAYLMSVKHYFNDVTSTAKVGDDYLLILDGDEKKALGAVLTGLILILASEIALIVLKKVFCPGITADQINTVLGGDAETPDEIAAEAAAIVAEAAAAEAAEAPAEETAEETAEAPEAVAEETVEQ